MPTKLGDVWMSFRLDTSKAEQDLNKLEGKAKRETVKRRAEEKPLDPIGKTRSETHKEDYFRQLSGAVLKKAGGGLSGNAVATGTASVATQTAKFLPPSVGGAAMAAGTVALAYGIVSETAKVLPEAFAVGKELAGTTRGMDERVDIIEDTLDAFRRQFVVFETKIMSRLSSLGQTMDHTKAVRRLTGQMPNTRYYQQMNEEVETSVRLRDDAFNQWKMKEAPGNWAQTMIDLFIRGLTR